MIKTLNQKFTIHLDGFLIRKSTGKRAGGFDSKGYRVVSVNGKNNKEHRLIWLMTYGVSPMGQIDHINQIKSDNRPSNLRDVTASVNQMNSSIKRKSETTLLGVSIDKSCKNSFRAKIKINGKQISLGSFASKEDAHGAYLKAKKIIHVQSEHSSRSIQEPTF